MKKKKKNVNHISGRQCIFQEKIILIHSHTKATKDDNVTEQK